MTHHEEVVDQMAEIARLRAELDEASSHLSHVVPDRDILFAICGHLRAELAAARQSAERVRTALTIIADWDRAPITGGCRESLLDIIRSICDCARAALQGITPSPE
jgi:hypothetical protein